MESERGSTGRGQQPPAPGELDRDRGPRLEPVPRTGAGRPRAAARPWRVHLSTASRLTPHRLLVPPSRFGVRAGVRRALGKRIQPSPGFARAPRGARGPGSQPASQPSVGLCA